MTAIQHGHFEFTTERFIEVTEFTQQDFNDQNVVFVHDGSEFAPSFDITVTTPDGFAQRNPIPMVINFINTNDGPVLINNALSVNEGATATLSAIDLSAIDPDTPANDLRFFVSAVAQGFFQQTSAMNVPINTFLQVDVVNSTIQFVHGGSQLEPSYFISVSDGEFATAPSPASITFSTSNDVPVLTKNELSINQGASVIFTANQLAATDEEFLDANLAVQISGITNGNFYRLSAPTTPITGFVQSEITAGKITFTHDNSEFAPSYWVAVNDTQLVSTPAAAFITFNNINDQPVLVTNQLTISEGEMVTIDSSNLLATDIERPDEDLRFFVSSETNGFFQAQSDPGTQINTFLQTTITSGNIQFIHNGGEVAPSYLVSVNDGELGTSASPASISFTAVNDVPVIINNDLAIGQGQTVTFSSSQLSATDEETAFDDLRFVISNLVQGQFNRISSQQEAITDFTQREVVLGDIEFVHDESEVAPSYDVVVVDDGSVQSMPDTALINFALSPEAESLNTSARVRRNIILGIASGVVGLMFLVAKLGISFVANKRMKKALDGGDGAVALQQKAFRKNVLNPIAKAVFNKLKVKGVLGYMGAQKSIDYAAGVVQVIRECEQAGVNMDLVSMSSAEQQATINAIAAQCKQALGKEPGFFSIEGMKLKLYKRECSPDDLLRNAKQIAKVVKAEMSGHGPRTAMLTGVFASGAGAGIAMTGLRQGSLSSSGSHSGHVGGSGGADKFAAGVIESGSASGAGRNEAIDLGAIDGTVIPLQQDRQHFGLTTAAMLSTLGSGGSGPCDIAALDLKIDTLGQLLDAEKAERAADMATHKSARAADNAAREANEARLTRELQEIKTLIRGGEQGSTNVTADPTTNPVFGS